MDSLPAVAYTSGPPPIPRAWSDSTGHPRRPLLIWIRTGAAHVRLDNAVTFHLTAGQGAWIPADGWNHREITTEPGTVAFPLCPHPNPEDLSEPTRFEVPHGWQDWLIQHFNLHVTPLSGRGYSQRWIADLLRRRSSRPPTPGRSREPESSAPVTMPAMPRARAGRAVAEELIRDPALDLTVDEWASQVLTSPRTLRRDFLSDTGFTFNQWRLSCRLLAAIDLLTAGYDVDQVSTRVGFASRNGFTRAFKKHFGPTPYEFSRRVSASPLAADPRQRCSAARQADDLVRLVQAAGAPAGTPDPLPAARTPPHNNDVHVLSWIYRGSGYLDVAGRRYERDRGVATWIPADLEHTTGIRENSISLPLGNAGTADLSLTKPLQVRFSPAWDNYLMFCSVSARSILHPKDYNPRHVIDLFTEQVAAQRAMSTPMPTDPSARAAATDYLRHIGTTGESATFDVPAEVHRAFREQAGMTFARWRYAARMRIARDLLAVGAKSSAVARRVGYAHLSTFSAAFARFHGVSPREYQERESHET